MFKKKIKDIRVEHPEKIKNFYDFLLIEIIEYLNYIRDFMNPSSSTAELLAKTDAMLLGFRHAYLIADGRTSFCPCCKYWCAGADCEMVKDAWELFLEEIINLKVFLVKTEL